jgi:hypothetical protein
MFIDFFFPKSQKAFLLKEAVSRNFFFINHTMSLNIYDMPHAEVVATLRFAAYSSLADFCANTNPYSKSLQPVK